MDDFVAGMLVGFAIYMLLLFGLLVSVDTGEAALCNYLGDRGYVVAVIEDSNDDELCVMKTADWLGRVYDCASRVVSVCLCSSVE